MNYLLDAHAFFWLHASPEKLSDSTLASLKLPDNSIWVSAATAYEISLKVRLGKWPQADSFVVQWEHRVGQIQAQVLELQASDMLAAGAMSWDHRDPFDRMLAAQAIARGFTLVSADDAFVGLPGLALVS